MVKTMRKLTYIFSNLFIILAITLSLAPIKLDAFASVEYMRIITDDTPFYSDANGSELLFNLPYTYYVKILKRGEILSHVECYGGSGSIAMDGYVPTDKLFQDDLLVQNPYLEKEITTISTAVLYSDKSLTAPIQYIFSSRSLNYYGQITAEDGSILFYVGYNNRLGYVEEKSVLPFELPIHPNELTFIQPELPPEETPEPEISQKENSYDNLTTVRIIVIACLLLAGLIALFVALKNKPKTHSKRGFYDENEYE